jgi:hypothetical protein
MLETRSHAAGFLASRRGSVFRSRPLKSVRIRRRLARNWRARSDAPARPAQRKARLPKRRIAPGVVQAGVLVWFGALGTPTSIAVGLIIGFGTFWRRPKLSLHERTEECRVERDPNDDPIPSLRLVARNGRLHRASKGTRALVDGYWSNGRWIPLGSVPLGWTSAADAVDQAVVIFADSQRAVDVGQLRPARFVDAGNAVDEWVLHLVPYFAPFDGRNRLRAQPDGYIAQLVLGSDDGRGRRYNLHVNWDASLSIEDGTLNAVDALKGVRMRLEAL